MLSGKFKYVLGSIFLLVLLALVAEAGFYFGVTKKETIVPSPSLPVEAPGAAPLIDQDRLAGFEWVRRGLVKGVTIGIQVEGTVKEVVEPDWVRIEKDGEIMGYKVLPEEPPMSYTLVQEGGEGIPITWKDLKIGDKIVITYTYDGETGNVISHSAMIFRQE